MPRGCSEEGGHFFGWGWGAIGHSVTEGERGMGTASGGSDVYCCGEMRYRRRRKFVFFLAGPLFTPRVRTQNAQMFVEKSNVGEQHEKKLRAPDPTSKSTGPSICHLSLMRGGTMSTPAMHAPRPPCLPASRRMQWSHPGTISPNWCADEGGMCYGCTGAVRFGSGVGWYYQQVTSSISCTAAAFGGDPNVGQMKHCECVGVPCFGGSRGVDMRGAPSNSHRTSLVMRRRRPRLHDDRQWDVVGTKKGGLETGTRTSGTLPRRR